MTDLNKPRGEAVKIGMNLSLHEGQITGLNSLYVHDKNIVMLPCGRKFGKTELVLYALWRHALLNPGSACFFVGPEREHGKKLIWDTQRLQKYMKEDTAKYIDGRPNNKDLMVRLKNGSFIQVMGSENWMAANGLTPDFVVYDEFKGFHPQFHIEMDPNRAAKAAPLVIIGTQPKIGDRNKDQYESMLKYCTENPTEAAVHTFTTFDNPINTQPHIKRVLDQQIAILRARGDEDVVQREYYSRIVPGGSRAVFPMFVEDRYVKPHEEIMDEIRKDLGNLEWYNMVDPGTTTCYASLFMAINPYTKKIYILDELYETKQAETSTTRVYPKLKDKATDLNPYIGLEDHDWFKVMDEAAAWAMTEINTHYRVSYMPTNKNVNKKENGLSLIKDILLHDLCVISDRCEHFVREMTEYAKDNSGKIPKVNDHTIDCLRYGLSFANYSLLAALQAQADPIDERSRNRFRGIGHTLAADSGLIDIDDWDGF